jgi:L-iditol 2-dehydrogenase
MVRLPPGLDAEVFIGGGCGLVTALHAVDMARIALGDTVVVLGVGPVGQSMVALAGLSGAGEIVAVGEPSDRLEFARRMGATSTLGLDIAHEDRLAAVRGLTGGRGADAVLEATGAPEAVSQALDLVRDGGRVVVAGHYTDHGPVPINPHAQINRKHVELRGCWGSEFAHFYRAVAIAHRFADRVPWREMVSRRYSLEQAGDALDAVATRSVLKALIAPHGDR